MNKQVAFNARQRKPKTIEDAVCAHLNVNPIDTRQTTSRWYSCCTSAGGTKEGWCSYGDNDTADYPDGLVGGKLKAGTLWTEF